MVMIHREYAKNYGNHDYPVLPILVNGRSVGGPNIEIVENHWCKGFWFFMSMTVGWCEMLLVS